MAINYGRDKAGALRAAVHGRLLAHDAAGELPTSNRFILYELRQSGGPLYGHRSRSSGRGEDQNLSDAVMWLREQGIVPWDWIVDETRTLTSYRYAGTVAEYLDDAIDRARIDLWAGEPPPLLLCESRTFGGVIARTIAPVYLCPIAATNGQAGGFLHTEVAPLFGGNMHTRPVIYIGDLDLRGGMIEDNTRSVLTDAVGQPLDWTRVALTPQQVKDHNLPGVRKRDRVLGDHDAVEVEALGQGTVTRMIADALNALLPEPLDRVQVREKRQRINTRKKLGL